jgi:hypothetical protein
MHSWQIAKQWQDENSPHDFWDLVGTYIATGLVFCTPQVFLLAREVHWDGEMEQISINDKEPNAWFVELGASAGHVNPVREFMRVATRPHQWALWCRRGEMRVRAFDWETLAKKVRL